MLKKIKFIFVGILGNIATCLWWIPKASMLIHKLRGVSFPNGGPVFFSGGVILDNQFPSSITLGQDVWLTRDVKIIAHSTYSEHQVMLGREKVVVRKVTIEDGVFLGVGVIVLPGVTIGAGAYVGAGSVVVNDIPGGALAVGNPCRVVGSVTIDEE